MFNNSYKIMFLLILMMGTMITISSNSWLGAWMGLEINLLSFIPLMSDNNNLMSTEASLKYFLTQALASSVLLFSIILMNLEYKLFLINNFFIESMVLSSLFLKSGTAPFHFWFPNVMEGLSWNNALILMTWQKIGPLLLISYVINSQLIMLMSIILSVMVGSLGGMNQTSLRKLMAFSSINHLGWMLTAMYSSESLWMIYFLIYSFLSFSLINLFNIFKVFNIIQLFTIFLKSKTFQFSIFLNLLSLGGLPPFLGFLPKWLVMQSLIMDNQFFLMTLLTVMTLIALFFYLRLCYSTFMLNYYENNWIYNLQTNKFILYFHLLSSFTSMSGLFLIWLIYFML